MVVEPETHKLVAVAVAVPPTEVGFTVTVAIEELAEAQAPLVITAL